MIKVEDFPYNLSPKNSILLKSFCQTSIIVPEKDSRSTINMLSSYVAPNIFSVFFNFQNKRWFLYSGAPDL